MGVVVQELLFLHYPFHCPFQQVVTVGGVLVRRDHYPLPSGGGRWNRYLYLQQMEVLEAGLELVNNLQFHQRLQYLYLHLLEVLEWNRYLYLQQMEVLEAEVVEAGLELVKDLQFHHRWNRYLYQYLYQRMEVLEAEVLEAEVLEAKVLQAGLELVKDLQFHQSLCS